jgi:hypothetical protein
MVTTYRAIADARIAAYQPLRSRTIKAVRDNQMALVHFIDPLGWDNYESTATSDWSTATYGYVYIPAAVRNDSGRTRLDLVTLLNATVTGGTAPAAGTAYARWKVGTDTSEEMSLTVTTGSGETEIRRLALTCDTTADAILTMELQVKKAESTGTTTDVDVGWAGGDRTIAGVADDDPRPSIMRPA